MKKIITSLVGFVFLSSPFFAMATCLTGVSPGDFNISLGKYSNWNSIANINYCNEVRYAYSCEITSSDTTVGNTTDSADTKVELEALIYKFGFECLDKAATLADKGQKAFTDVFPEDLGFPGALYTYFQAEANRCWNHYFDYYESIKDKVCTVSLFNN